MKAAPIMAQIARYPERFEQILVHTGQHYDHEMSRVFFEELGIPSPNEFLNVGSGTHAEQTARVMLAFEPVLREHAPDWLVVVGDVNSTLACALVCSKLAVRVAHVEAGLRSGDRSMPEEINRILVDQIADLLFTPSTDGNENLCREGVSSEKVHFVGNVMIDTLVAMLPKVAERDIVRSLGLRPQRYALATIHRPSNADETGTLKEILAALTAISHEMPVVFPVHPRTRRMLTDLSWDVSSKGLRFLDPLGYLDFVALMQSARYVITDSGGVQEETTFLQVPCLTVRPNTERPVTIARGTNQLVDGTCEAICRAARDIVLNGHCYQGVPEHWDGRSAERIVKVLLDQGSEGALYRCSTGEVEDAASVAAKEGDEARGVRGGVRRPEEEAVREGR